MSLSNISGMDGGVSLCERETNECSFTYAECSM